MNLPPFSFRPAAPDCPLLITVTHAGRDYRPALLRAARVSPDVLAHLEDPLVDGLVPDSCNEAGLLVANVPRACIDLNRAPDDLEPGAVRGGAGLRPTHRARVGLGVVPTRLPGAGALWREALGRADFQGRIDGVHAPFHALVERELARILDRCGVALLLDLHSMPGLEDGTQVVFGDRHGASCGPHLAEAAHRAADTDGLSCRFNAPYAGGHVVARHGRPLAGVHALQVELSRELYLDRSGRRPGPGWARAQAFVASLAAALIDEVTLPAWRQAAE